ncbi:MAG: hypothetical protein QGD91_09905 [Actinomycetota bacterium]|nr:hypothetical protein [Actinomycetota bacterium]
MTAFIDLTIDKQNRMSVGKLGFATGHARAEELPDGSGWIVRPAKLVTEAEGDIWSRIENVEAIERSIEDLSAGRVVPRHRR